MCICPDSVSLEYLQHRFLSAPNKNNSQEDMKKGGIYIPFLDLQQGGEEKVWHLNKL